MITEELVKSDFSYYQSFMTMYDGMLDWYCKTLEQDHGKVRNYVNKTIHVGHPKLSIKFINKLVALSEASATIRIENNISFDTEYDYYMDDFKYMQEHFNDY